MHDWSNLAFISNGDWKSLNKSNYNFFLEGSHPICISGTRTFLICLANNAIRLEEKFSKHAAELVSKMSACTEPDTSFIQIWGTSAAYAHKATTVVELIFHLKQSFSSTGIQTHDLLTRVFPALYQQSRIQPSITIKTHASSSTRIFKVVSI